MKVLQRAGSRVDSLALHWAAMMAVPKGPLRAVTKAHPKVDLWAAL
jgi:hypothetical protein